MRKSKLVIPSNDSQRANGFMRDMKHTQKNSNMYQNVTSVIICKSKCCENSGKGELNFRGRMLRLWVEFKLGLEMSVISDIVKGNKFLR